MKALRHGAPGLVGHEFRSLGGACKRSSGPAVRRQHCKYHHRAGYGFVVFVLHLDNGFPGRALPDIVDGAFALDDHDAQPRPLRRWFSRLRRLTEARRGKRQRKHQRERGRRRGTACDRHRMNIHRAKLNYERSHVRIGLYLRTTEITAGSNSTE